MAGFRELRGVNVNFLFSNPEKAHPCAEPSRLTYSACKSVRGLGCDAQFRAYVEKKPLRDHYKILLVGRYPGHNHLRNFW